MKNIFISFYRLPQSNQNLSKQKITAIVPKTTKQFGMQKLKAVL